MLRSLFWCLQQNSCFAGSLSSPDNFLFELLFLKYHRLVSTFPVARLIWKTLLIVSSCSRNLTGRFASGDVLIWCHIISCFVWVTLALNGEAAPAAAMIRKVFISKWCFLNGNKSHIAITAQLIEAKSFLCRFSLRSFSVCRFLSKDVRVITEEAASLAALLLAPYTKANLLPADVFGSHWLGMNRWRAVDLWPK